MTILAPVTPLSPVTSPPRPRHAPVDEPQPQPQPQPQPTTRRYRWHPVPVPSLPVPAADALSGRSAVVLGGSVNEREAVLAALVAHGATARGLATPAAGAALAGTARVGSGSGWPRLDLGRVDVVVDLGLPEGAPVAPGAWWPALAHSFAVLRWLHRDWSTRDDVGGTSYLTVTRMGGLMARADRPVPQPFGGLWSGLAKGLPREFPSTAVRVLDLDDPGLADLGPLVVAELGDVGVFEVGYRAGVRHLLRAGAEPVSAPTRPRLGPDSTVAMAGGGRGIGFALACRLARTHGCRVVVSGRGPEPRPDDPVTSLDDLAFAAYRRQALIRAAAEGTLAATRRRLLADGQRRELAANLAAAREEGLTVEYLTADVTVPDDAARLLAAAGPRLTLVVHDAGVDVPARLPEKDPAQVERTVGVKADGFLTLWQAARDLGVRPAFSLAGSMTGRWGGMVGQLEYGAANEVLATLAGWANHQEPGSPVTTMAWPTWQELGGMISNYEATLAYMAAMPVEEGLDHWEAEILGGDRGEVGFLGEVGAALTPTVLRGYHQPAQLPHQAELSRAHLLLGTPLRYRPGSRLHTTVRLDPDRWPIARDVLRAGVPSVPVALLLELMRATGSWLAGGFGGMSLSGIRDLDVDLDALDLARPTDLRVEARTTQPSGQQRGQQVWVQVSRRERGAAVATGELHFGTEPRTIPLPVPPGPRLVPDVTTEVTLRQRRWVGAVLPVPRWAMDPVTGSWWAELPALSAGSLTAFDPGLDPVMPVAAIETAVRALVLGRGPHAGGAGSRLKAPWIDVALGARVSTSSVCRDTDGRWTILDADRQPLLRLHHPRLAQDAAERRLLEA